MTQLSAFSRNFGQQSDYDVKAMTWREYVVVCLLGLAILSGLFYFGRKVFFPFPNAHVVRSVYVPPIVKAIKRATQLRAGGKLAEARKLLRDKLRLYPTAAEAQSARDLLGQIDTQLFFATNNQYAKTEYVVKRGDSLWHIARTLDSTPFAIVRINNLKSNLIHPGEKLVIPDSEFTLVVDLPIQRVIVLDGDRFFKQYPIVDINLPRESRARVTTKVTATTFWKNGKIVSPDEIQSGDEIARIQFKNPRYVLYGVTNDATLTNLAVGIAPKARTNVGDLGIRAHGIAMFTEDLDEIRLLIRRGTPVIIIRKTDNRE